MKKMLLLLIFATLCMTTTQVSAKKWRVNNSGIPADFTTANAMINSPLVNNGDTAYFESSMFSYGGALFTKRLVVFGPGFFLGENDSTQANPQYATLNEATFDQGSDGTVMKGMTTNSWVTIGSGSYHVNNITLECNNLASTAVYSGSGHVIIRNYMPNLHIQAGSNILVAGNIMTRVGGTSYPSFSMWAGASATVSNNVFVGNVYLVNAVFRNNIQLTTNVPDCYTVTNSVVENNIGASTQFGNARGNQQNVDMTTVFLYTGSSDGKYRLKPGSPAIGAGVGGVDCGSFGGNYPYVLSGMVSGPSVWYMNLVGPEVTVKAKSH
jgi:hypothetical protein